jgi:protein-L-isoaspartate(D-aspartate) O-methyltransferase
LGWEDHSPYNRIMVTAAASEIPKELLDQLAPNGRMIIPVGPPDVQDLILVRKDSDGKISEEFIEKVRFVRLKGKYE